MRCRQLWGWAFGVFLVIAVAYACAQENLVFSRVIDGDSGFLSDGREIRLIGIDCPEFGDQTRNIRNARRLGINPETYRGYAMKAAAFARQVMEGKAVRLEYDPANLASGHKDVYGRTLAYIYARRQDADSKPGEMSFNALMIRSGHAFVLEDFPFGKKEHFLKLQREAERDRRGMWEGL